VGYEYNTTDIYHQIEKLSDRLYDKVSNVSGNSTGINSRLEDVLERLFGFSKLFENLGKQVLYVRIAVWIIAASVVIHVIHHW
jgi:hypothetical protein